MHINKVLVPIFALGLFLGCGGGSTGASIAPAQGTLALRLGSDSIPGYSSVVVGVEKVEWSGDGSTWNSLGTVKATYDLAKLQNGNASQAVLLSAVSLAPTTLAKFRITWALTNYSSGTSKEAYAVPFGGNGNPMSMPVTSVFDGPVTVVANSLTTAQLMLNGDQAVQGRSAATVPFSFQPTGRVLDLALTAKITGHLTAGATNLNGVEVFAETMAGGVASVQRRSLTDATGGYVLDALPIGAIYYVAAQPAGVPTAYQAQASAPISASTATTFSADLNFTNPLPAGTVNLLVTPVSAATEGTWAELRQTLATGTSFQPLIVRSLCATSDALMDRITFTGLATGVPYDPTVQRSAAGAAPKAKAGTQVIPSGTPATFNITLP